MHDKLSPSTPEITEREVIELLDKYGVPYGQWGTGSAKSVQDLLGEVVAGEACLNEDGQELTRVINGLGMDIFVRADDARYKLIEARQEFPDGIIRVRDLSTSLGEKIKAGEGIEQVIARARMEEIGIDLHEAVG